MGAQIRIQRMAPATSLHATLHWNALAHKSLRALDRRHHLLGQRSLSRELDAVKKFKELAQLFSRLLVQFGIRVRRAQKLARRLITDWRSKTRFDIAAQDI